MYLESGENTHTAKSILRTSNAGSHVGSDDSVVAIESRPVGSGANGPTNADFGQTISIIKKNFSSTTVPGEMDGLNIVVRQGGPTSDSCAILANVATYGTGFMAAMESTTSAISGNVITEGIQTAIGIVDNVHNKHYGMTVVKNYGMNTGDGYYVGDGGAGASFANAFRVYALGTDVYTVNAITGALWSAGSIRSSSPTGGIGYAPGAGGAINQSTSKSTDVTVNRPCGIITMFSSIMAPGEMVIFNVSNNTVVEGDTVVAVQGSGGAIGTYWVYAHKVVTGGFRVLVQNLTTNITLNEAPTINFTVTKGSPN